MIEFIKNNWTEILSVVGAAAWLPIVFSFILNCLRRIHVTVLDSRVLTNAFGVAAERKQKKKVEEKEK